MSKLESIKCPDCGAPLNFTDEQEYCFCSHCGAQIYKEDVHYDKRHELKLKKLENEDKQDKRDTILFGLIIVAALVIVLLSAVFFLGMR